ncbi:MAG: right-handed parallel beta-helix repeat-containing protein [Bacteroidales bacterium]|nr:right-handed parallel beta-helix repeat-containing protein [Bacteroidales bacterium]
MRQNKILCSEILSNRFVRILMSSFSTLIFICTLFCHSGLALDVPINVYIDPSAVFNGDGTMGGQATKQGGKGAFNSWSNIKFEPGHAYYQKCSTRCIANLPIDIHVKGSLLHRVKFGAYYIEGSNVSIGVQGQKPIIKNSTDNKYVLFVWGSVHLIFENLDIQGGYCSVTLQGSSHIVVDNCDIGKYSSGYGMLILGKLIDGQHVESNYGEIKNCRVDPGVSTYGNDDGIKLTNGANYWEIHDNIVTNWGHDCIYLHCKDVSFSNGTSFNKVYKNKLSAPDRIYCRGFETWGSASAKCDHNEIYYNVIENTNVRNQVNGSYNKIYYNIIDTVKNSKKKSVGIGQGIDLEGFGDCVCENNEIFNNVIANCDEAGIRIWVGDRVKRDNKIFNNIIYNCGKSSVNGYENCGLVIYKHASVGKNFFKNNCIYNDGINNNVFYRGSRLNVSQFNEAEIFQQDNIDGNVTMNPLFIDVAHGDFRIRFNSSCKNAGINHTISADYYGNVVPSDIKTDIGVNEIVGPISELSAPEIRKVQ